MKEKRVIRVGMAQMLVNGGHIEENLSRAEAMIQKATTLACDIVVLPECSDIGWTYPKASELARPIPGDSSERICRKARECGIYVVIGLTEKAGGKTYNAAILISPGGEILLRHRKINVLDIEQPVYATGDSLAVAETVLGTIGVNICADNFPSSLALGHALARMGAQIILSPCAWAVRPDHDNTTERYGEMWRKAYTSLARLYDIPVVGVSNVGWVTGGPWDGDKCIGCSLAVGAGGRVLAEGPYGVDAETLLTVDMEITPREVTGTDYAPMLEKKGYVGP